MAHKLDLDEGSPVAVRRRVLLADGLPVALTDSYYPAAIADGTPIEQTARIPGGVHALIEDPDGPIRRMISRSEDGITARMPTPDGAAKLRLHPGVLVLRVLRTVYNAENRSVEVQRASPAVSSMIREGIFGIAQRFPGSSTNAVTGPAERDFRAPTAVADTAPDYPAAQAAGGAALAVRCADIAGTTRARRAVDSRCPARHVHAIRRVPHRPAHRRSGPARDPARAPGQR